MLILLIAYIKLQDNKYNIYQFKNMRNLFYGIYLLIVVECVKIRRLSTSTTQEQKSLKVNDQLVSTLGLFRAVLQQNGCCLRIQVFNNLTNKYDARGKYSSPTYNGNCNRLDIRQGRIVTQTGSQYLSTFNVAYNYSTVFTIDDLGTMRLISTYEDSNKQDLYSTETVISNFYTPHKYIGSYSKIQISFYQPGPFSVRNERGWDFLVQNGQVTIHRTDNHGIAIKYPFSWISIRDTRIYDFNNLTFPSTIFYNISFPPRCSEPKKYLDFQPPYVFYANPYWPIGQLYQQGGYKIYQMAFGNFPQYQVNQNITDIYFHRFYSPCPRRTFEYRGDCLSSCPQPYYHLIKGESGFCVLNCEQYSVVNETKRICSCHTEYESLKLSTSKLVVGCPSGSNQTPFACECNNVGQFFDYKLTFACVKTCPRGTFGINKMCMRCPDNCNSCRRDDFFRQFFQCTECQQGFTLSKGQCIGLCKTNYASSLTINNNCLACVDQNCNNCSTSADFCQKCGLLYTLYNGRCYNNCTQIGGNLISVYSSFFKTVCLPNQQIQCTDFLKSQYKGIAYLKCNQCMGDKISHLDRCVSSCPIGYYNHNNYCACSGMASLTINNLCLNQIACPIKMYFDISSNSCLSCPFGCITCNYKSCTSCYPGYFLYASPQIVACYRKSPLRPCDNQYAWQRNSICTFKVVDPMVQMHLCFARVPNCKVCPAGSDRSCVVCQDNFLIYNNTCITKCPDGLIQYQQSCVLPQIANCSVPHLSSYQAYAKITKDQILKSQSYNHYIFQGRQRANDPVGYIPFFQQVTGMIQNDGTDRQSNFFQPSWICLKCDKGFGLTDDYKRCILCPPQCAGLCYFARTDSCISGGNVVGPCGLYQYIDQQTNVCLDSCNSSNKYPEIREGKLYCVVSQTSTTKDYIKVDSAVYKMFNGQQLVFFAFSQKLSEKMPSVQIQNFKKLANINNTTINGTVFNGTVIINGTTTQSLNSSSLAAKTVGVSNQLYSTPLKIYPIINGQYVVLQRQNYDAYLMNLRSRLLNLSADNQVIFPSSVYGTVYQADHTVFMTAWLAYIGYIMSIVIILLHAVFIGNQLLYKVDNLLIFVQTIFYFSYVKNLVGRLLAQFYFGWSFAHARFLPNLFRYIIPDHYIEMRAPVSYKLVNMDGNYFRNAGFSLVWLLIYIGIWLIITFVVWALIYRLCRKPQPWYPRVARQSLAAGFQFFAMNLWFFSVAQLAYSGNAYMNGFQEYFDRSQILAILTIVVISIYTIARFFFQPLGGLYMVKRIVVATILVFAYEYVLLIIPLVCFQILFAIFRHVIQRPILRFQKISIWLQCVLLIACYFLLWFCLDAGVNTIIISILIFLFIVYLAYDLTTIYLQSLNQFPEEKLAKDYDEAASEMYKERAMTVNYINGNKRTGGVPINSRGVSSIIQMT